jgi:TfoX/Sxy family transcriptional regulator of competence genes
VAGVPYDEDLVHRLRELLADETDVTEKKMFGGHAFLLQGHLCVAASRNGGLMARIDPGDADRVVERQGVELMVMRGRALDGWITIAPQVLKTKRQLAPWVKRGTAFVKTLPAK